MSGAGEVSDSRLGGRHSDAGDGFHQPRESMGTSPDTTELDPLPRRRKCLKLSSHSADGPAGLADRLERRMCPQQLG